MALTASEIIREILSKDLDMLADAVIQSAKQRGVTLSLETMRSKIYNIRSDMKKKAMMPQPLSPKPTQPGKSAATKLAPPAPAVKKVVATPVPTKVASDLPVVLSNVALVNKIVGVCGGPDQARQTAEAVRTCGGVDLFLQYLKLVAGIRTTESPA